jgi:uncharacterized protein (TIGR02246 family)
MTQVLEAPTTTQTNNRIGGLIDSMRQSWNRHDIKTYAALFEDNADFVNVVGMHWRGRAEIEATHIRLHETIFRNTSLSEVKHAVRFLTPEIALVHATWQMLGAEGLENWQVPEVRHAQMSLILRANPNAEHGWLITALHNTEVLPVSMSDLDKK